MLRFPARLALLSLTGLLAGVRAQTFVVDVNNGPGTDFTSLATATSTAPDGAVLLVRAGFYIAAVTIQGKSLTILADPGVELQPPSGNHLTITIDGIAANQSVFVRGLRMNPSFHVPTKVRCQNSPGVICIEDMSVAQLGIVFFLSSLDVSNCAGIYVRNSRFQGTCTLASSNVAFVGCELLPSSVASVGFVQTGGATQLTDTFVHGQAGGGFLSPPAISLSGGDLRLLGSTEIRGGSNPFSPIGLAIGGTGNVRVGPSVVLIGAAPIVAPTITSMTTSMPHIRAIEVPSTGNVETELYGAFGVWGFVVASLVGPVATIPELADSVWLDPLSLVILAAGVPGAGSAVVGVLHMPTVSTQLGFRVVLQGLTLDAAGFQISNPEYFVVH